MISPRRPRFSIKQARRGHNYQPTYGRYTLQTYSSDDTNIYLYIDIQKRAEYTHTLLCYDTKSPVKCQIYGNHRHVNIYDNQRIQDMYVASFSLIRAGIRSPWITGNIPISISLYNITFAGNPGPWQPNPLSCSKSLADATRHYTCYLYNVI